MNTILKTTLLAMMVLGATSAMAANQNMTVLLESYSGMDMAPPIYGDCASFQQQIAPQVAQVEQNLGISPGTLSFTTDVEQIGSPAPTAPGMGPQPVQFSCYGYYQSTNAHWGFARSTTTERDHLGSSDKASTACNGDLAHVQAMKNTLDAFVDSGLGLFAGYYCSVSYIEIDSL